MHLVGYPCNVSSAIPGTRWSPSPPGVCTYRSFIAFIDRYEGPGVPFAWLFPSDTVWHAHKNRSHTSIPRIKLKTTGNQRRKPVRMSQIQLSTYCCLARIYYINTARTNKNKIFHEEGPNRILGTLRRCKFVLKTCVAASASLNIYEHKAHRWVRARFA